MNEKHSKKKSVLLMLLSIFMVIGMLPVYSAGAAVTKPEKGSITVFKLQYSGQGPDTIQTDGTKLADLPANYTPMPDIKFYVMLIPEDKTLGTMNPTQTQARDYWANNQANEHYSDKTGAGGFVKFDNLTAGNYLVFEDNDTMDATDTAMPMVITTPMMNIDGTGWMSDVYVYTKALYTFGAAQIYKYDGKLGETYPLEGATFTLYAEQGDGMVSGEEGEGSIIQQDLVTGADGYTPVVEFLLPGNYYFMEDISPANYLLKRDKYRFTITEDAYDQGILDPDLITKVKAANYMPPTITKDLLTSETADIGATNTWSLSGQLPKDIMDYTQLVIKDVLDPALTYSGGLSFKIGDNMEIEVPTSSYFVDTPNAINNNTLTIKIIDPTYINTNMNPYTLYSMMNYKVTFNTQIDSDAIMGKAIENSAEILYNNSYVSGTITSGKKQVKTGGQQVMKLDNLSKPLAGAKFYVKNSGGKYMAQDSNKKVTWVDKTKATQFVSPASGLIKIEGLNYGTYYLEEFVAPKGYNLLVSDAQFIINDNSYTEAAIMNVVNSKAPVIPVTGGIGTIIFYAGGALLMAASMFVLLRKKKAKQS